jgi:hypothetical protein
MRERAVLAVHRPSSLKDFSTLARPPGAGGIILIMMK